MTVVKESANISTVPNQPKTRAYSFRLPPAYIEAIDERIKKAGGDRTVVVRAALRQHLGLPDDIDEQGGDDE